MLASIDPLSFLYKLIGILRVDYSANHDRIQGFEFYLREQADRLRWPEGQSYNDATLQSQRGSGELDGLPVSHVEAVSYPPLGLPASGNIDPPMVPSDGQHNAGDVTHGLPGPERAPAYATMSNSQFIHGGETASISLASTDVNNLSSSQTSFFVSSSMDRAGSSLTSTSRSPEEAVKICRCKTHTDDCDRSQFASGAKKCITCQGCFPWTANALPCIVLATEKDFLCRCKWHNRACRRLQDDYDARKCDCCKGWLAFSEQANKLIKTTVSNETAEPPDSRPDSWELFLDDTWKHGVES
jgi:hypothetical protein